MFSVLPFFLCCVAVSVAVLQIPDDKADTSSRVLERSPHHLTLTRAYGRRDGPTSDGKSYATTVRPAGHGLALAAEVKFNGIPRYLQIDTGSADTWMVTPNFQCLTATGKNAPQSQCYFGDPYIGNVKLIPDINFLITYGSGFSASGRFARTDVEVAGLVVKQQQVALVDRTYWIGNNVTSGLLGLAPRLNTFQYAGAEPSAGENIMHYSPIFEGMYNRTNQIAPIFSLDLRRGKNAGYLAFGGLPPSEFSHDFVTTKLVGVEYRNRSPVRRFYPIQPEGFELDATRHNTSYKAIVDSGTYNCLFPKAMADKINAAFDPPAQYNALGGGYLTHCNATVPKLGIKIGRKTFHLHSKDMLVPHFVYKGLCATTITRGYVEKAYPEGFYVLGDVFLNNVVAVFDVGSTKMHFASK